jgi:hypothetical protein
VKKSDGNMLVAGRNLTNSNRNNRLHINLTSVPLYADVQFFHAVLVSYTVHVHYVVKEISGPSVQEKDMFSKSEAATNEKVFFK